VLHFVRGPDLESMGIHERRGDGFNIIIFGAMAPSCPATTKHGHRRRLSQLAIIGAPGPGYSISALVGLSGVVAESGDTVYRNGSHWHLGW